MKTAIVVSTKHGNSEKIAELLSQNIKGGAEIIKLSKEKNVDLGKYDAVILGASVYIGKINKKMADFIKKNETEIMEKRYALYLSCGNKEESVFTDNFSERFLKKAVDKKVLGTAYNLSKLSFFERIIIKKVAGIKESIEDNSISKIKEFAEKI